MDQHYFRKEDGPARQDDRDMEKVLVNVPASSAGNRSGKAVHEGLLLLDAVALFSDGNAESGMRRIKKLQRSQNLHELINLLCPGIARQRDRRAQRIRRAFLKSGNERGAFSPIADVADAAPQARDSLLLTSTQKAVLGMVSDGLKNRQIAARLLVSENTVKWHLKVLSRKLGANNRLSMVRAAERRGLLSARHTVALRGHAGY